MALIVWIRETLYRFYFIRSYSVSTKVLSVGNLTFGGTGKTPTVDFLLTNLKSKLKIAVISRGYGRSTTGFYKVDASKEDAAKLFGDEPVQLSRSHPDIPFYVCEDRVSGCKEIEKDGKFDLIIADDAFQHLALRRDIDVVVVDATEEKIHYKYPPVGRARNSFSYLKRADFVFLTKTNLCRAEDLEWIRQKLKKYQVIEFESSIEGFYDLESGRKIETPIREASLISGIGKPKTFEKVLKKLDVVIREHFVFKDHYDYTEDDIRKIKAFLKGEILLTTEKDAVKLRKFSNQIKMGVAKLQFVNKGSMEKLYEALY